MLRAANGCRLERLEKGRFKTAEEKAAGALETEALKRIQAALEASQPARSVPLRCVLLDCRRLMLHRLQVPFSISRVATHGPAFARLLGLCSTLRRTHSELDLGHV